MAVESLGDFNVVHLEEDMPDLSFENSSTHSLAVFNFDWDGSKSFETTGVLDSPS